MNRSKRILSFIHLAMLSAGLAVIIWSWFSREEQLLVLEPDLEQLKEVLNAGVAAGRVEQPLPHYPGAVSKGAASVRACALATAQLEPKVKGYVDQINLLVALDEQGEIHAVKVIAHRETPHYMELVLQAGLLERFSGRNVQQGFADIDAVTGATITSRAIIDDLASASARAAAALYQLEVPGMEVPSWGRALREPKLFVLAVVLMLSLYSRFGRYPRRYRREAVWVLSIILLGFYLNTPYSLGHNFQLLSRDLPGPANLSLLVLAGFVVLTTLAFGPLNCGFLCPFGGLQELLFRLMPRRWEISPSLTRWAREIRYLVLFICVLGFFGLGIKAFSQVEPFPHLFSRSRNVYAWLFIGVVLAASLVVPRFWCRFFCPTGACLVLLSAHRKYLRSVQHGVELSHLEQQERPME